MAWFLCLCLLALVVCVIIQTYNFLKTSKQIIEYEEDTSKSFIQLCDKNNTFVFVDQIVSIGLADGSEIYFDVFDEEIKKDKFYIIITVTYSRYLEEYDTKDEAVDRINELLDFIDTYYR